MNYKWAVFQTIAVSIGKSIEVVLKLASEESNELRKTEGNKKRFVALNFLEAQLSIMILRVSTLETKNGKYRSYDKIGCGSRLYKNKV